MTAARPRVCFIAESGADVRLIEGLAARLPLTVIARAIPGGRTVSQSTNVPVHVAPSGRLRFAWHVLRVLMRDRRCDLLLVQGYGLAALAANLVARFRGLPCWMLVCSPSAEYYAARRSAGAPFSRLVLAGIHVLAGLNSRIGGRYIVLSEHLSAVVARYGGSPDIAVIPVYGVDVALFAEWHDRRVARSARGLPASGQIIFSSSRVAPEKDAETLMTAFAALVREGRDVYLLSRCGGFREVERLAQRAGVPGRVIATDAVDPRAELPLDYAASDVCVQASRAEGLGFSVLEAFACGTPVVASAIGGLMETVRAGVTGWTVPPGDSTALAEALRSALDDPEEARRRARAGRALVHARFERDRVFSQLVARLSAAVSS